MAVEDLAEGMYVAKLDRPWVGTPFPIQGFHIQNTEDIRNLGLHCKHVYVDVAKSRVSVKKFRSNNKASSKPSKKHSVTLAVKETIYQKTKSLKQEISKASKLHSDIATAVDQVMGKIFNGKPIVLSTTKKVANKMVQSIANNPDAFIWIARIRDKDEYTYSHSVRASIWAITFGRYLGLKKERLQNLAIGTLLSEIGKTELPDELLIKKDRLTNAEFETMKKHVFYGVELLEKSKGINHEILSVVTTHHERHNGTGYPRGLRGDQIPLLGRIAGVVDFYDAITCPRYKEKALSPSEAMIRLHDIRGDEFQAELVDDFIQAIGIYPTGSLVELSSGEVGVITEQNSERRLRPKILLLLDQDKKPLRRQREIDLQKETRDAQGNNLNIAACLPEGAYDIDLSDYRKKFVGRLLGLGNPLFHH